MPDGQDFHIILLPHENYWDWVSAIRDYVVHFGTPVTPFPENAIGFHRPLQTVTIVDPRGANAYPLHGDIGQWFQQNGPDVRTDILSISTPDELRSLLAERIAANQRFGTPATSPTTEPPPGTGPGPGPGITLWWPTDYDYVTQGFGENPDYYSRFNLPGHEGVDIRAPAGSNIYACADGVVYRVERDPDAHLYGIHVRIEHEGGYKTVYAHLEAALVNVGDAIEAGQIIGLADNTGNSFGDHLHLAFKLEGATNAGLTNYPYDLINPEPFLLSLAETPRPEAPPAGPQWAYDKCLVGLHGRADGAMQEADWQAVATADVEALKLLSWARAEDVDRARQINPNVFILMRAMFGFTGTRISPSHFADTVSRDLEKHYNRGVRYIEIHNEPNLAIEGWGSSWHDGSEFAHFFLRAVELLRPQFPEARWGWPGLSPGPGIDGQRFNAWDFLQGARDAIEAADWLGVHCYWQGAGDHNVLTPQTGLEYQAYRDQWPDKLLFLTEFSNTSRDVDKATKARHYLNYYQHLRNQESVGAAFSFVVSASRYFGHESWRGENGSLSAIPGVIGGRPDF